MTQSEPIRNALDAYQSLVSEVAESQVVTEALAVIYDEWAKALERGQRGALCQAEALLKARLDVREAVLSAQSRGVPAEITRSQRALETLLLTQQAEVTRLCKLVSDIEAELGRIAQAKAEQERRAELDQARLHAARTAAYG